MEEKKTPSSLLEQLCLADTSKKGIELNSSGPCSKSVALPPPSLFHFFFFFLQRFLLLPHETSHLHFRTSAKLIFWSLAAPQWYQRDQVKQHPTLALCCVSIMQRCATGRMCLCLFASSARLPVHKLAVNVRGCVYYAWCYSAISHRAGVIQLDLKCERFFAYKDSESVTKELLQRISQSLFSSQAHYHWKKNHLQKINCRLVML